MNETKPKRNMLDVEINNPNRYNGLIWPVMPGFYPDIEEKLEIKRQMTCRDSDIFLCSYPKAGTNWVQEILSMLISQSTEYNLISPLDNFLDIQPNIDDINSFTSPRLLVTHVPYPYLPTQLRNGTGKIVHVQRNPKDLNVSMYNFLKGRSIRVDMPWEEYIEGVIGEGDVIRFGGWFKYTKEWEKELDNSNILVVYYEDMKRNLTENVDKIAEFIDASCTKELAEQIADRCSFDNIKKHRSDPTAAMALDGKSTLYRKGQVGDWKNWFTVSQNERFDEYYKTEMKDSKLQFTYEL